MNRWSPPEPLIPEFSPSPNGGRRNRFERRLDIHVALLNRAAAIICSRFVDDLY